MKSYYSAQQDKKKKKGGRVPVGNKVSPPATTIAAGIIASVEDSDRRIETVAVGRGRERDLAVSIARTLNEGYFEEQAILARALINAKTDATKAVVKDLADSFDPTLTVSGNMTGASAGVSINIASPAKLLESLAVSGIDARSQVAVNRVNTISEVNKLVAGADAEYQGREISSEEIRRSLTASAARGIAIHKRIVTSTLR